jgi:predicted peptidase
MQSLVARLRPIPIWVFHSAYDVVIPFDAADSVVKAIKSDRDQLAQASPPELRFTRYAHAPGPPMPEYAHLKGHGSYELAFRDPEVFSWLEKARCRACDGSQQIWTSVVAHADSLDRLI